MVIYDGLHYDALAVSAFQGAPEELDITVLRVRGNLYLHKAARGGEGRVPKKVFSSTKDGSVTLMQAVNGHGEGQSA
jgi:hypothetical protein